MAEIRTLPNDADVIAFLDSIEHPTRRADGHQLLEMFTQVTGEPARMWGASIIGFGTYHYKSERSRQEGDWMLVGFSPRKAALSLYLSYGYEQHAEVLARLGKHKFGKGCLYINKLTDVDVAVLRELVTTCYTEAKAKLA
jgi:hypothetical protein